MSLNRYGPAVLACALLLGACAGEEAEAPEEPVAEAKEEETPPVPVETGSPVRGNIYAIYSGTAPIEAFAEADVIAKVEGEVREILVEEGMEVAKGKVLARLDGDMLRLELSESEARLRKLQRDYERNIDLQDKGLISTGDFDKIRYEMEALEASYNLAKLELDYTQIRAPIAGVVAQRYVKIGNTIRVGEAAFRVTSLDPLVAYLHIPEREYRNIREGQAVGIEIDALRSAPVVTSVTRVSPIVDPETGTFKVTVEIDDPERRIKPGMFGRFGIVYDMHENALQVPRSAILEDDGETSVFIVVDNKAQRRPVTTGYSNKGMVEIIDGIDDGVQVVTVGHVGLKEDASVAIINAEPALVEAATPGDVEESEHAPTD
jgi:membrane fusion protein (multidrug efflux system)